MIISETCSKDIGYSSSILLSGSFSAYYKDFGFDLNAILTTSYSDFKLLLTYLKAIGSSFIISLTGPILDYSKALLSFVYADLTISKSDFIL